MKDFFLQSHTIWFLIGFALILLEFVVPGFVLVFFGIGAWVTAIVCWVFDVSINVQLFIFLISSIASLALLRRAIKKRYMDKTSPVSGGLEDEYIGQVATAVASFAAGEVGRVSFKGANWEAIATKPVKEGDRLRITGYKSIQLFVEPIL
ncbi:MAG: NfeD family protein [Flavipsychrobacter sp.]